MFPFFKGLKPQQNFIHIKYLCVLLSIFFIPAIFVESLFYSTIYVDTLLGLIFGYVLISYFTKKENDSRFVYLVELVLGLIFLSLLKETGVILSGLMFLIIIFFEIITEKRIFFVLRKNYKKYLLLLLAFFGTYISWKIVLNIYKPIYNDGYVINGIVGTSLNTLFYDLYSTMTTGNVGANLTFHTFFQIFLIKPIILINQ